MLLFLSCIYFSKSYHVVYYCTDAFTKFVDTWTEIQTELRIKIFWAFPIISETFQYHECILFYQFTMIIDCREKSLIQAKNKHFLNNINWKVRHLICKILPFVWFIFICTSFLFHFHCYFFHYNLDPPISALKIYNNKHYKHAICHKDE